MQERSRSELGIGLIGVGRHGSRYLQHLLHDLPGVSLTAVCRKTGGKPLTDRRIPIYNDFRAMIADRNVQAIVVVTPPSLNHDICLEAANAGKPILIEKPLATNGRDARAMVAAASRAGIVMMTAQTLRFDPTIVLMKERIEPIQPLRSARLVSHIETKPNIMAGATGPVQTGALLELGVHLLDLVRFVTGQEISEARCTMTPLPSIAPETSVQVQLMTTGGILCTLEIARVDADRVGMAEWVGQTGTVMGDWPKRLVTRAMRDKPTERWAVESKPTVLATLEAFIRAVVTKTPPPITGLDGCRAVEIADACYRSAADGGSTVCLIVNR